MKASWGLRPGMPTLPEKAPPLLCCFICLRTQSGFLSIDITKSKYRSSLKKHWSCLASIQPRFNSHVKTNKHIYLFSVHICVCAKWEDCLHTGELFKMYLVMIYYQQMPDSPCYDIHDMVGLVKIFSGQEKVQVEKSLRCLILFYFILSLFTFELRSSEEALIAWFVFICVHMWVICLHGSLCTKCIPGAFRSQRGFLIPPFKNQSLLPSSEPSLQPHFKAPVVGAGDMAQ